MHDRVSAIKVDAGLYTLSYVKSRSAENWPSVEVRALPESAQSIEVVSSPFESAGMISEPGGCVVLRVERSSQVQIIVRPHPGSSNDEAELQLESLHRGKAARAREGAPAPTQAAGGAPSHAVRLLGHVSRRGDVQVTDGSWLAGPDAPAPIEGLSLALEQRIGHLSLEYQVMIGGPGGGWTPWLSHGQFAGTRGQFKPLVGVRARLAGQPNEGLSLEVQALFLGASVDTSRGTEVELMSPAGVDPLVGFKLALVGARSEVERDANHGSRPFVQSSEPRAGRVRVFRASGGR